MLILFVLLKKKPIKTEVVKTAINKKETYKIELSENEEKSDDNTNPYKGFFNGIVTFEEKIKGVNDKPKKNDINFEDYKALINAANKRKLNNSDKKGKDNYTDNMHSVIHSLTPVEDFIAPPPPKKVFPEHFYRVVGKRYRIGFHSSEHEKDFYSGNLSSMRSDALAYYYKLINDNTNIGMNPARTNYNHFPLSRISSSNNSITIALYLVQNLGNDIFLKHLIGGDVQENLERGRNYEAELFKHEIS